MAVAVTEITITREKVFFSPADPWHRLVHAVRYNVKSTSKHGGW